MEEFRDIPGYKGLYQVSNLGNVKSLKFGKERILKHIKMSNGYLYAYLSIDGIQKFRTIHQLVAMAFLNHTPCGFKLVVDHINDNPKDNRVDNLQIVTHRFNIYKTQGNYSSKHKGVSWSKATKKWGSGIVINGKSIHLGLFKCELAASVAYQKALEDFNNGKEIERNIRINSSKYKGVCWSNTHKKWLSQILINGKLKYLGLFEKEFDAHVAYQNKLLSLNN